MKNSYSVKTKLRTDKKRKNGTCPIYYSVYLNGKTMWLPTGKYWEASKWDFNSDLPKGKSGKILKRNLDKGGQDIIDFLVESEQLGKTLNMDYIKRFYNGNSKDFYDFFDDFCNKKFKDITIGTQRHYLLLRKQLKEYKSSFLINDIDYNFLSDFFYHLKCNNVGPSGIAMRRKNMITVLEEFVRKGYMKRNPCRDFPKPKENERDEFLTLNEIDTLKKIDLSLGKLSNGLNLTRDMFLFSCYTGLRYSDVSSLKRNEIKNGKITKVIKKTKTKIVIPLSKEALILIKKYKHSDEIVFPHRSNVSVNRDLKLIATISNIKKRVSFHTARHTFGTLLAQKNVQPFFIMKLLGHRDVRMTNRYVNTNNEMISNVMSKITFSL